MTETDKIDELRSLLIEWRNGPEDVWFVEGPINDEYRKRYGNPQGEQELLISIITAHVESKIESLNPKITTYALPKWKSDGVELEYPLSAINGHAMNDRVQFGKPDEYFVVAAAGDNDSRPPYVVYLAQGGRKWPNWWRLGGTNNNWYDVRTLGLFGNVSDDGGDAVSEERMEDMEKDDAFWFQNGSLGWSLKIKFVGVRGYAECLNWNEWPEELL